MNMKYSMVMELWDRGYIYNKYNPLKLEIVDTYLKSNDPKRFAPCDNITYSL